MTAIVLKKTSCDNLTTLWILCENTEQKKILFDHNKIFVIRDLYNTIESLHTSDRTGTVTEESKDAIENVDDPERNFFSSLCHEDF